MKIKGKQRCMAKGLPTSSFATTVISLGVPSPFSFSALTLKVYSFPSVRSFVEYCKFNDFITRCHLFSSVKKSTTYPVIRLPPSLRGFFQPMLQDDLVTDNTFRSTTGPGVSKSKGEIISLSLR